jgi:hypothetical protein
MPRQLKAQKKKTTGNVHELRRGTGKAGASGKAKTSRRTTALRLHKTNTSSNTAK